MSKSPLRHVLNQIDAAKQELKSYEPTQIDWFKRCKSTARRLVPWLAEVRPGLEAEVIASMNSPQDARQAAESLFEKANSGSDRAFKALAKQLRVALQRETLLIAGAGGTVVSKLIEQHLIEHAVAWELESNGASDYPDIFLRSDDYSALPVFKRKESADYGAALKGPRSRPVRIPDGLEIKTCKDRFAVDCHHAHVGLHLVFLYEKRAKGFVATGVQIGFMRRELYRVTVPASPTTTLKASFNSDHFMPL